MNYLHFDVLLTKLVGAATPEDPILQGVLEQCRAARQTKRGYYYRPASNSEETRAIGDACISKDQWVVTYAFLSQTIEHLDRDPYLEFFQAMLHAPWPEERLLNLATLDSTFFQEKMKEAKSKLSHDVNNREHYVLILKAVFALKIYIARARADHPIPFQNASTEEEAVCDFNQLKVTAAQQVLARRKKTPGQKACDFFMEEERVKCAKSAKGSLTDLIRRPQFIQIILTHLHARSSNNHFIKNLFLDLVPSDFNALYVKDLITTLSAEVNITSFFNPTGGWSARLIAAMASDKINLYMETDPNTALHHKKISILQAYNAEEEKKLLGLAAHPAGVRSGEKTYLLNSEPVEDLSVLQLRPEGRAFNMVFYSPPYLDLEAYPDDGKRTQSHVRYSSIQAWLEGFLYPSIQQSYTALSCGGIFAINIAKAKGHDLVRYVRAYMAHGARTCQFEAMKDYDYSMVSKYPSPILMYRKCARLQSSISYSPINHAEPVINDDHDEHDEVMTLPPKKRFQAMRDEDEKKKGLVLIFSVFKDSNINKSVCVHDPATLSL